MLNIIKKGKIMNNYKNKIGFFLILCISAIKAEHATYCKTKKAMGTIQYLQTQRNVDWSTIKAIYADSCGMGQSDNQCPNKECFKVVLNTTLEQLDINSKGKEPNANIVFFATKIKDITDLLKNIQNIESNIQQLSFSQKTLDEYKQLPPDQRNPNSPTYQLLSNWYKDKMINSPTPPVITDQDTAMEKYFKRQVMLYMCVQTQADCNPTAIDYFKAINDIQDIAAQIMTLLNKYGNEFSPAPVRQNIAATNIDGTPFSYKNQPFNINKVLNWRKQFDESSLTKLVIKSQQLNNDPEIQKLNNYLASNKLY